MPTAKNLVPYLGHRRTILLENTASGNADRLGENQPTAVVSGESATKLHRIGDLRATRSEFTTPSRKQTQRAGVRHRNAVLPSQDVMIIEGLPATTRERAIADLVEDKYDLSVISDVLRDAARWSNLDTERLIQLLHPLVKKNGHREGNGAALLNQLMQIAGIDQDSLARRIVSIPGLSTSIIGHYLSNLPSFDMIPILDRKLRPHELASLNKRLAAKINNLVAGTAAGTQTEHVGLAQYANKQISGQVKTLGLLLTAQSLQTGEQSDGGE